MEVDEVVRHLRLAVSRIHSNIGLRAPHGSEGAAKALVTILEAVAARNKDPLDGNNWGRTSFHGEDEDQRNLYHLLIGCEAVDLEPNTAPFVLEALEALHPSALYQWGKELGAARDKIAVNRAPKAYLLRLDALVRAAESASSGSATGSGQKRPAAGNSGGHSKRSR